MNHVHLPGHGTLQFEEPSHQPPRGRRVLKGLILTVVLLLVTLIAYVGFTISRLSTNPLDFRSLDTDAAGRTNILILGVGDKGHAGEKLSDTVMVLSLQTKQKKAAFISLPRDLRVPIPGHGSAKINQAHALGGTVLAVETVEEVLDIPIHYFVRTDFTGLREMVDAVGGLDITVKERLRDPEYPCDDNPYKACGIDIQPGAYHMDGRVVLQYVRCRKGTCGNDFGRAERQQEVLDLLQDKLVASVKWANPLTIDRVVTVVREYVRTDLSVPQLVRVGYLWRDIPDDQIKRVVFSTAPDGLLRSSGGSDLVPAGGSYKPLQAKAKIVFD